MSTVLIVGAGASTELGIPCGQSFLWELISRLNTGLNYNNKGEFLKHSNGQYLQGKYRIPMINQLLNHYEKLTDLDNYDSTNNEEGKFIYSINSFREDLEQYIHKKAGNSIDAFLACNHKQDYSDIGMFVLAYHFIGYEAHSLRESFYCKDNWLRKFIQTHFRQRIGKKKNDIGLKIITFNYERLIEYHIRNFLKHEFRLLDNEIKKIIDEELEVVHVYGKIGDLLWQKNAIHPIEFGSKNDDEQFLRWTIDGIKLIGWRPEPTIKKRIRNIIEKGSKFIIMGFGFDKDNMRYFKFPPNAQIISTAYGIDKCKQEQINKDFNLKIEFMRSKMKCADFVDNVKFTL